MAATSFATELRSIAPPHTQSASKSLTRRVVLSSTPSAVSHAATSHSAPPHPAPSSKTQNGLPSLAEDSSWQREAGREAPVEMERRDSLLCALACATLPLCSDAMAPLPAEAREKRQKTNFPEEDYVDAGNGLRYLDIEAGKGKSPEEGEQVKVHFEVRYGPLTVVSTRESKLLGGNRSISQPYLFVLGAPPGAERRRDTTDSANGLFSAQAAPKPPKALYVAVAGMKIGGKRSVLVPAEQAYGEKGYNEIPPGAQVQLIINLLDVNETD